jgi:RHS repeat-associated protein
VLASVLGDGLATYTPGISERRGGASRFFHAGIKSFDAQTDESGSVAATRRYDAFGNTLAGGWTSPFAHAGPYGYQTEASGLQLLGHRYYDPSLGRFLSKDPAEDGRNHHTYCWNNPASSADPDGQVRLWNVFRGLGELARKIFSRLAPGRIRHVTTLSTRLIRKIEQKIPNEWGKGVPAQKGGGIRYTDPGNQ